MQHINIRKVRYVISGSHTWKMSTTLSENICKNKGLAFLYPSLPPAHLPSKAHEGPTKPPPTAWRRALPLARESRAGPARVTQAGRDGGESRLRVQEGNRAGYPKVVRTIRTAPMLVPSHASNASLLACTGRRAGSSSQCGSSSPVVAKVRRR